MRLLLKDTDTAISSKQINSQRDILKSFNHISKEVYDIIRVTKMVIV